LRRWWRRPGLRAKRWHEAKDDVDAAAAKLERRVRDSTRTVSGPAAGESCLAFGQWVGAPEEKATRHGQHGIYGTAAGIEILAGGEGPDGEDVIISEAWTYLGWKLGRGGGRKRQFYIVLRQAMVLRALGALDWAIGNWEAAPAIPPAGVHELAGELLAELKVAKEKDEGGAVSLWVDWPSGDGPDTSVLGYRFASRSPDAPPLATTWAFHQAAVLNAVTICSRAKLTAEADSFLVDDHAKTLVAWCNHILGATEPDPVAVRVALFAGWSVLGLDHGQDRDHRDHMAKMFDAIAASERQKLRQGLERAVRRMLREEALQTDLHLPFLYRLPEDPPERREGNPELLPGSLREPPTAEEEAEEVEYRQEHLVVPTVPILLSVVARLEGPVRFDHRYLDLLQTVTISLADGVPPVVPAQPTAANGTVNLAYLRSALSEVSKSLERIAEESFGWRLVKRVRWRRLLPNFFARWHREIVGALLAVGVTIIVHAMGLV
jgi:hypothetical protein